MKIQQPHQEMRQALFTRKLFQTILDNAILGFTFFLYAYFISNELSGFFSLAISMLVVMFFMKMYKENKEETTKANKIIGSLVFIAVGLICVRFFINS